MGVKRLCGEKDGCSSKVEEKRLDALVVKNRDHWQDSTKENVYVY